MKQEMYSNIIGKEVWNKCQKAKIWIDDYNARIEVKDTSLCDRIDIQYDARLEAGEIEYVDIVWYGYVVGGIGEESQRLSSMPMEEQKKYFDLFEKELPYIK